MLGILDDKRHSNGPRQCAAYVWTIGRATNESHTTCNSLRMVRGKLMNMFIKLTSFCQISTTAPWFTFRHSHILNEFSLINKIRSDHSSFSREIFFELAHHLLKANPHKYLDAELAARLEMPLGREY
ncbi:hypothetical protein niasHT_018091 [Heterodera trifolii]|uniref:Uncharacterized protein n=1 Tax=Heterodera trifolii TaxID=157864 RepID=A0ABD2KXV2_9BILA